MNERKVGCEGGVNSDELQKAQTSPKQADIYTARVSWSCIVAQLGVGIATAALMAALFASGGAAALAVAGYATSAISVVQSCR